METNYRLTNENIDIVSEQVAKHLAKAKIPESELFAARIQVEDALIQWQEKFSAEQEFTVEIRPHRASCRITLSCRGEYFNPLNADDDEMDSWVAGMRSRIETVPKFSHFAGRNRVDLNVVRVRKDFAVKILIALALGLAVGFAGRMIPLGTRTAIVDQAITPIYNTYLSVLGFCGIPLIFLSMVLGIVGVGDVNNFNRIGRKLIARNMSCIVAIVAVSIAVALPFFDLPFGKTDLTIDGGSFLQMILGWLPANPFSPIIDSNAMHLVIMGSVFGAAILILGKTNGAFIGFMNDVNSVLLLMAEWMTRLIPLFAFVTLVKNIWMNEVDILLPAWKSWVITTGLQLIVVGLMAVVICVRYKVSFLKLIKKVTKTFLIALGTNSCTASIVENYRACEVNLGIDPKVFVFGIPVGTSTFKPATAARLVLLSIFMADSQGMTISAGWVIMLFVMSVVLSIAIPAIPGGTLMFCGMLFSQLGIPTEVIAQMLTTDIFFDAICTALNQIAVQFSLVQHAGSIDMLNKDILRS